MHLNAQRRDKETAGKTDSRSKHGFTRPCFLQPLAEYCGGKPQKNYGKAENPAQSCKFPILGIRAINAWECFKPATHRGNMDQIVQWLFENTECVNLPNRQVNGKGCRGNKPAAESRFSNGVTTIKKGECTHGLRSSSFMKWRSLLYFLL
jgi:hypothetical protein